MSPEEIRSAFFQEQMLALPPPVRIDDQRLVDSIFHGRMGIVRIGWYKGEPWPEILMLTPEQVSLVKQLTGISA